eukprot:COSAG06_NODE_540_length_14473_cov_34.614164_9_plen_166_part_00
MLCRLLHYVTELLRRLFDLHNWAIAATAFGTVRVRRGHHQREPPLYHHDGRLHRSSSHHGGSIPQQTRTPTPTRTTGNCNRRFTIRTTTQVMRTCTCGGSTSGGSSRAAPSQCRPHLPGARAQVDHWDLRIRWRLQSPRACPQQGLAPLCKAAAAVVAAAREQMQ